ncbi:hypothetical protein MD484_g5387, partial [Candolleomyces efflorescens]
MNKNPFLPAPTYTPPQPPLPPGPPPNQPGQPDYSAWYAASAAAAQQPHAQPPAAPHYNPQWSAPQQPRPPAEQSALYANYGYGSQNSHWQRQQQQPPPYQQPQPYHGAPQVVQPPQAQPGYNPYQPAAGYALQYVPQAAPPPPQPIAQPAYTPVPPQQPFFNPHLPPHGQPQPQQQRLHHTPPQHMPPAKRQRFDGPNPNRNQQHPPPPPPPQPQFQPPPAPPSSSGSFTGPNLNRGPPTGPGSMTGRGGGPGGRGGGAPSGQRGRGGSFSANRGGGPAGRGRGTGSGYMGGSGNAGRGGGQSGGGLRGHGSRANFGQNRRTGGGSSFTSGGGFHQPGSFRNRGQGQGHSGQNRTGPRHDSGGTFAHKENTAIPNAPSGSKKEENRRTLTDFKIVGLEIPELDWTWGDLPLPAVEVKVEVKEEAIESGPNVSVKDEVVDDKSALQVSSATSKEETQVEPKAEATSEAAAAAGGTESQKISSESQQARETRYPADVNSGGQPPSRMRIYFDTPVTADDAKPIPHTSSAGYGDTPSDARKGKRKKLEDDDGDLEEGRVRRPPPQMSAAVNDDRSSVAASVAESASEGDWLMAAIVEGEEEAQAEAELQPGGEEEGGDGTSGGDHTVHDEHHPGEELEEDPDVDAEGEVEHLVDDGHDDDIYMGEHDGPALETAEPLPGIVEHVSSNPEASPTDDLVSAPNPSETPSSASEAKNVPSSPSHDQARKSSAEDSTSKAVDGDVSDAPHAPVSSNATSRDNSLFESTEETSANQPDSVHVQVSDRSSELGRTKSLQSASAEPTLLVIETQEATQIEEQTQLINGQDDHAAQLQAEHLPEPPMSPVSNVHEDGTTKAEDESSQCPSRNRLSISYASGNRRLVIDADAVSSFKLFRQAGRIEVAIDVAKNSVNGLKGVLVETLSEAKSYAALPNILEHTSEADQTVPPFSKLSLPTSVRLVAHLDVARPLSEPKWAKSGDVQEWLRSMLGSKSDESSEGWEKKIQVVDPDPPPTIWTVLEGWASNSPVGLLHERQRFLKTHMTETDNVLEILLRLVRGERATPFSQNTPTISGPSISGALLSALNPGSAHGAQQTHVSLAVLALFRLTVEYAKKAVGEQGELASYQQKMFRIDDHIGIAIAGLTSDARVLSNFMRQQAMSSRMIFNRPVPVNRLVSAIADKAQVNTQEYGRRPYGVGFLVIGQDKTGPHLYEFSPSGNSYEYYAMSIGARSQSAKTYLEKHYESFADCSLEDLIRHGLHALRETLQQDKELTVNNTSIGIIGPASEHEKDVPPGGSFRILENEAVDPFLKTIIPKDSDASATSSSSAPAAPAAAPTDDDVQMAE